MRTGRFADRWLLLLLPVFGTLCCGLSVEAAQRPDDTETYHRKWLEEDVIHLITEEERALFVKLGSPAERDAFIEQFWRRRDPDPRTSTNEFREEHYRRVAYANQHFSAGLPGWKTDRGKIYILHGAPDSVESMPLGGIGSRSMDEGGGSTAFHPFEVWHYRYLAGVGENILIEFVDRKGGGFYEMARDAYDKDALFYVPAAGLSLLELTDYGDKKDRVMDRHLNNPTSPDPFRVNTYGRAFEQIQQRIDLLRPPPDHLREFRSLVSANASFPALALQAAVDVYHAWGDAFFVPVTVAFPESSLSHGEVLLYGRVEDLNHRIIMEFEESKSVRRRDTPTPGIQKKLPLRAGRYKLTLVLKDPSTGKTGIVEKGIVLERIDAAALDTSTLTLAEEIAPAGEGKTLGSDFILSGYEVVPRLKSEYTPNDRLKLYLEIYNTKHDVSTGRAELSVAYRIQSGTREGQWTDISTSVLPHQNRFVLVHYVPLWSFAEGSYRLQVRMEDRLAAVTRTREVPFSIVTAR